MTVPIRWPWLTPRPEPLDPEVEAAQRAAHDQWLAAAVRLRTVLQEIDENIVGSDREDPQA